MAGPTPSEDRTPGLAFRDPVPAEVEGVRLARDIGEAVVQPIRGG